MKNYRSPLHWLVVALVLIAALLAFSNVYGQRRTDAGAVFEGRPQMSGAQGGLGAQAGPSQGGVGVQGTDAAGPLMRRDLPQKPLGSGSEMPPPDVADVETPRDKDGKLIPRKDGAKPKKDPGVARDQGTAKKTKRAAKRTVERARHGVSPIDSDVKAPQ